MTVSQMRALAYADHCCRKIAEIESMARRGMPVEVGQSLTSLGDSVMGSLARAFPLDWLDWQSRRRSRRDKDAEPEARNPEGMDRQAYLAVLSSLGASIAPFLEEARTRDAGAQVQRPGFVVSIWDTIQSAFPQHIEAFAERADRNLLPPRLPLELGMPGSDEDRS